MIEKSTQGNKAPTSKDVARAAGVSQSTVSRVFSDKKNLVKPEVQEQIMEVAKKIGYRPNLVARGMISGKTNIVALVIGENIGPYYSSLINMFISKIQQLGKQCLVFRVTRQSKIDSIISKVIQFHVEAVIITASAMTENMVKACNENDIPIILYNRYIAGLSVHMVYADPISGGALVAEYLCSQGHKRLGYIQFVKETSEEVEKKIGFHSRIREYGVFTVQEDKAEYSYEDGYKAGIRMLKPGNRPTAIFCTSDIVALGVMDAARYEYGMGIPGDLSVIGYDDISMSSWKTYGLTTVRQPTELLVDKVMAMLESLLQDKAREIMVEIMKPELIIRGSVTKMEDNEHTTIMVQGEE